MPQYRVNFEMIVDAKDHESAAKLAHANITNWEDYMPLALVTAMPSTSNPNPRAEEVNIYDAFMGVEHE